MEQQQQPHSMELDFKERRVRLTGNDIFTMVSAVGITLLVAGGWYHHQDSKEGRAEFIQAIREQTGVQKESSALQREQNCLFKFKPEERHLWADTCKTTSGAGQR